MRRPSLFKTPKHQRFTLKPRHYDPVKEEIDARVSRIQEEVRRERAGEESEDDEIFRMTTTGLRGAFKQRSNRTKSKSVNFSQLVILGLLVGGLAAYWYYGNTGLYIVLLVSSVLLYLRLRRII